MTQTITINSSPLLSSLLTVCLTYCFASVVMNPHSLASHCWCLLVYRHTLLLRRKKEGKTSLPYPASITYNHANRRKHYSVRYFPLYPRSDACQASAATVPVPPAATRVAGPPPAARSPRGAPVGSQLRRSSALERARTRRRRAGTSTSSESSPPRDLSP